MAPNKLAKFPLYVLRTQSETFGGYKKYNLLYSIAIIMMKDTIQISTVVSFITQIQKHDYDPNYTYFYRGHSDYDFELKPSIYRNQGHLKNEDTMYRELVTHNPSEFTNSRTTIDHLVKMQHYGLPTRLLDLTTNPLISLFFACEDASKSKFNFKKGEVIVFKIPNKEIKYSDSDTVAVLSNIAKMKSNFYFKTVKDRSLFNESGDIPFLLHSIGQEKGVFKPIIEQAHIKSAICIKAKMENPRIVNQSGAFFLFGCSHKDKGFVEINKDWIVSKKRMIIINKKTILAELKLMGISEKFVYPSLEKYTDFLKDTFYKVDGSSDT